MLNELVQLSFDKIMQTRAYTVIILGSRDKRFAIYTDPSIGKTIQMHLTGVEHPRPLTHTLIDSIFRGFKVRVIQVVINDVQDTIYYARLFLELDQDGIQHLLEIDARPSDCLMLAIMNGAPVFCTREVLNKTIPIDE